MKIALVHDYIKEYGGAERVLEALHDLYPNAPVYTSLYVPASLGPHRERFRTWDIRTSWMQAIPFHDRLISILRLVAPLAFMSFDFSGYDVVITSATGAYFPNTLHKGEATLICYCHTPPRYLYGYATAREWKKNSVVRVLAEVANHFLRMVDFKAAQHVDYFIANSEEVKRRIQKFYRKDATVIYPPVNNEISNFKFSISNQSSKYQIQNTKYYLAGGRLARPKHIDLIVEVCTKEKLPLIVFGKDFAGYGEELRTMAGESVQFVGEVGDDEKMQLMAHAKAYIFSSEDEDFGITPVEAMSVGTPVIAYRSGGVQETVVDGKTGIFFDSLTEDSLKDAIKEFAKKKFDEKTIATYAKKFAKERFLKEIAQFVSRVMKN